PITGRLFDRYGAKWLALGGLGTVTITTFMFTNLSPETTFTYLTIVYAIRMFGLALTLMPVMTSALNQMPPKWYSHGSDLANTLQPISAAMGTALLVTLTAMGAKAYERAAGLSEQETANLAQIAGFEWAFLGCTLLAFLGFVLSLFLLPPKKEKEIVREIHGEQPPM